MGESHVDSDIKLNEKTASGLQAAAEVSGSPVISNKELLRHYSRLPRRKTSDDVSKC